MSGPQLDIDSIEARTEAATPEPWQYSDDASVVRNGMQIAQFYKVHSDDDRVSGAQFTAHARSDVPALCREVRQLRQALAEALRELDDLGPLGPGGEGPNFADEWGTL